MLGDRDWFTEIKQLMDGTSRSYFETIINLIKWNTALAVGAILWFGSYIVNTSKPLNWILTLTASVSLLCLVLSIAISIGVFYSVSRFFKEYWLLWSKYGERDLEMGGASDTILDLVSY